MLNGIDPIIIFQFSKATPEVSQALAKIPLVSEIPTFVDFPPIPIYLSEQLTGLFIDSETKSIDAQTDTETKTDGSAPNIQQKGINATLKIEIIASKDSLGLSLLAAMSEILYEKLTSKEYAVTYMHGAITIFRGLVHSFSISQIANEDKYSISLELSRGAVKSPTKPDPVPEVPGFNGTVDQIAARTA